MTKTGKAARGRPAAFDRETAVKAAMEAFWSNGFEAMSVSDLADAMAIRRSSFYNSFGTREAVFAEAVEAYRRIAPDAALAEIGPGEPVVPAVRRVFREICRVRAADAQGRGCLLVNSISQLVGVNEELGEKLEAAVAQAVWRYETLIRQAVAQGEFAAPGDIPATARAFVAFVAGLNTISKVIRDEGELWRMCGTFLDRYGFGEGAGSDTPPARS